jgi:hypothetical protein
VGHAALPRTVAWASHAVMIDEGEGMSRINHTPQFLHFDNHQSKSTAFDFFYYPLSPIYSLEPLAPRPPG